MSGNPALAVRALAREAMLCAGGRGFMRFLPPGGALLATDALARGADAAQAARLTAELADAGFACARQGPLLALSPTDALLRRMAGAAPRETAIGWDAPLAPAQALAAHWLRRDAREMTPAGRALATETLRLLWRPQRQALAGLDALRAQAAANQRAGDMSGQLEAGRLLAAWLEYEAKDEEERI